MKNSKALPFLDELSHVISRQHDKMGLDLLCLVNYNLIKSF